MTGKKCVGPVKMVKLHNSLRTNDYFPDKLKLTAFAISVLCMVKRPMTSDFEGFLSQILSITFLFYLNSSERASISLFYVECQIRTLWYYFYFWYDVILLLGLDPGPPALEASTLPLGYRGSGP